MEFYKNKINFLGHEIKNSTLILANANIDFIRQLKPTSNFKEF